MFISREEGSFRDSSGYVFYRDNNVFRTISWSYKEDFEEFHSSGLFNELVKKKLIVNYDIIDDNFLDSLEVYKIVKPDRIPFITYPFEWSFSQLKAAALLTLEIQLLALKYNFSLKDASAFNVQFIKKDPVFIDTSSFEKYSEGSPWVAYKQFCQHFLAPLLLSHYGFCEVNSLVKNSLDGINLKTASIILPYKSKFNLLAKIHIHWHSKVELKNASNQKIDKASLKVSKQKLINIITHLQEGIKKLDLKQETEWADYYQTCSYNESNLREKESIIETFLTEISPNCVLDLGCNEGVFSKIASKYSELVVATDFDDEVINRLYKSLNPDDKILPLIIDICNPTPFIGWNNKERKSFLNRVGNSNTTLALALIHHLAIGNNVPLNKLAEFFHVFSEILIIEFVPKEDSQTQKLLVTKEDIFSNYNLENFLNEFAKYYDIKSQVQISDSERIIFKMERKK
ncbi:MAG: SAM-dependent methyltransferase [Bacteroidetes bacterium]|nr:SAM-dependent methyltransferase [Bacteroidota bacterium]